MFHQTGNAFTLHDQTFAFGITWMGDDRKDRQEDRVYGYLLRLRVVRTKGLPSPLPFTQRQILVIAGIIAQHIEDMYEWWEWAHGSGCPEITVEDVCAAAKVLNEEDLA